MVLHLNILYKLNLFNSKTELLEGIRNRFQRLAIS
jgi:hypothetical protein